MLPAINRMRKSYDFSKTTHKGDRVSTLNLVAYISPEESKAIKVGFIVNKSIGGSVARHRTQRQLRHLVSSNLHELPQVERLVIRVIRPLENYTAEWHELLSKLKNLSKKQQLANQKSKL
jgi:ribonuclease P protein component